MPQNPADVKLLSIMVRGAYDLQMLRMQAGARLAGNFRAKLFNLPTNDSSPENESEPEEDSNPDSESDGDGDDERFKEQAKQKAEAKKIIAELKKSYRNLTAGIARNRTLPDEKGFKGDALISTFPELQLVNNYLMLEKAEDKQFESLESQLERFPIWTGYLSKIVGIGPAMGGVIVSRFDPHKARNISSFWAFAGIDIGPDGRGRSKRSEHLVEREYLDKNKRLKTRMSVTYDPWVKTKLMGVLASSFFRQGSQPWRDIYDAYKHRLVTDPNREKVTLAEWKKRNNKKMDVTQLWSPGRIDWASKRYMIKQFLAELWVRWRELEGLPVTEQYHVAKQGGRSHWWERRRGAAGEGEQPTA